MSEEDGLEISTPDNTDAIIWRDAWIKAIDDLPGMETNKRFVYRWFANAILVGYEAGVKVTEESYVPSSKSLEFESLKAENNGLKVMLEMERKAKKNGTGK